MRADLSGELRQHREDPFPETVEKGTEYGDVDPVMIDADIYGWALSAPLSPLDRRRLQQAATELERSLPAFPTAALPYYRRLLRIAELALIDSSFE